MFICCPTARYPRSLIYKSLKTVHFYKSMSRSLCVRILQCTNLLSREGFCSLILLYKGKPTCLKQVWSAAYVKLEEHAWLMYTTCSENWSWSSFPPWYLKSVKPHSTWYPLNRLAQHGTYDLEHLCCLSASTHSPTKQPFLPGFPATYATTTAKGTQSNTNLQLPYSQMLCRYSEGGSLGFTTLPLYKQGYLTCTFHLICLYVMV